MENIEANVSPVKWAVAKSWHLGVGARNTSTVVSHNKDSTEGRSTLNVFRMKFPRNAGER